MGLAIYRQIGIILIVQDLTGTIQIFFDNCSSLNQKGKVIIQGDLNAHTNTSDLIMPDAFDEILGVTHNPALPIRNTQDKKIPDRRDKELIDFCKSHEHQKWKKNREFFRPKHM